MGSTSGGAPMVGGRFDKDIMFNEEMFPFLSDYKYERQAFAIDKVTYVAASLTRTSEEDLIRLLLDDGVIMKSPSRLSPDANYVPFEWAQKHFSDHPASRDDWRDYRKLLVQFNFPLAETPVE
ncbi:MAG: hypothetical protein O2794_03665 [bacterium]|nr:hypothetical protein [bacterium]